MSQQISAYFMENWDGWPLHVLIATLLMHPIITNSYPWLMFGMHVVFWPLREAWQQQGSDTFIGGLHHMFYLHQMIEWGAPIIAAGIMLVICLKYPYRRKR